MFLGRRVIVHIQIHIFLHLLCIQLPAREESIKMHVLCNWICLMLYVRKNSYIAKHPACVARTVGQPTRNNLEHTVLLLLALRLPFLHPSQTTTLLFMFLETSRGIGLRHNVTIWISHDNCTKSYNTDSSGGEETHYMWPS